MDLKQILKPVWKGGEVIAESAMYLEGNEEVKLMFPRKKFAPSEILRARSFARARITNRRRKAYAFFPRGTRRAFRGKKCSRKMRRATFSR